MKHIFVINPAAGKGKNLPTLLASITYACEDLKVEYDVYHTQAAGDATTYVSETCKQNPDKKFRFYACGGDGTLSEVLNGAVGNDNAEIAVIPAGTGNDFVKTFRHPEYFTAIQKQVLGTAEKIDLLKYNDRYSLNIINVGFDCDVVVKVAEIKRKARRAERLRAKQAAKGKGDGISLYTILVSICCMGLGITPLNIGEMSYVAIEAILRKYQEKEKY